MSSDCINTELGMCQQSNTLLSDTVSPIDRGRPGGGVFEVIKALFR